jgi:hypothetical protein
MLDSVVAPSITTLYYSIYYFLVNHPLLNNGLVKHTLTGEPVEVSQYRVGLGGFPVNDGLTCSIYPLFDDNNLTSPATINASVLYNTYNLGVANEDEAKYHFIIDYSYRSINVDGQNRVEDEALIKVPKNHVVFPKDIGKVNRETKEVDLYINPALDVVTQYIELTRLALEDTSHQWKFPLGNNVYSTLGRVEPIHINLPTIPWQKGTSVLDTRGYLLIRLNGYMTRDWRKIWEFPLEDISLEVDLMK